MTEIETTITAAPKKTARKADPLGRILSDVRAEVKELGEFSAEPTPEHRRPHHLGRFHAWAQQYAEEGTADSMLLTRAFVAASTGTRLALIELAAVAVAQVEKLDGGK
ncbi:hypothetical protein [Streptomyces sp. NPDC004135]